mgnify:CR=1 FL=1
MLFYFLIGFVTFIGSGIVIYSIFYISVASSIRNYGQLRTIGTTKRQIKKMVYREGKLLAAIAIPIGLVIGNVIGYFLIPAGWYWLTTLCVTVGVGLFCIYYCDDCHSYSCKKSCGSISAGSIAIFRLSGENERKFRVAP